MTYKTGMWGEQAKARSRRYDVMEYQREYRRKHPQKYVYKSHGGDSLGFRGEMLALTILKGSERIRRPCDLKWEGKLVDVKTGKKKLIANKHINGEWVKGKAYVWKFLLTKQKGKVDLFLIICKDLEDKVQYIFLIPDKDLQVKNLTIAERQVSKYSKYLLTLS